MRFGVWEEHQTSQSRGSTILQTTSSGFPARNWIIMTQYSNLLVKVQLCYYFVLFLRQNQHQLYEKQSSEQLEKQVNISPYLATVAAEIAAALKPFKHPKTLKFAVNKLPLCAPKKISCFPFLSLVQLQWSTIQLRLTGLGQANAQLCMGLWDPKAKAEVLILFPGSGNASGGQGPHEREIHFVARPEQSGAEPGLRQAQGQARCNSAHIKKDPLSFQ